MKILFIYTLISLLSTHLYAGDAKLGKSIYKKKGCMACHKKDGMGAAKFVNGVIKLKATAGPQIAGLDEKYILTQLLAIQGKDKATKRKTKFTGAMKVKLKSLSEKDFEDLASYLSKVINPKAGIHKGLLEK